MERIKRILSASGRKNNWLWAIGLNLTFLMSILLFCDIKYEVSDDFVMSTIISGAYGNGYNPHLMFINILWGYLLLPFYYLCPSISWYLIAQLLLCFLSFTVVSYMLLERLERPIAFLFIVVLLTIFADDAYILVQFTKTAMIAVMGGGIVFLWILFYEKFRPLLIGTGIICLAGTLVRFMTIYIAGGFFLIILVVEFWKLLRNKNYRKSIYIIISGGILICVAVGMKAVDSYIYNSDEEYAFYKEYNAARASVTDASDYGYEAYETELEKIGISENDYNIMRSWSFGDNDVFSVATLEKTGNIIDAYKEERGISKEAILESFQARKIIGYPICIACIVIVIASIILGRKEWLLNMVCLVVGGLYLLYFFVIERTLYRIEYGIFLGVFLSILLLWKNNKDITRTYFVEMSKICAILILVCFVMESVIYIPDKSYQDNTSDTRREYIENVFNNSWDYDARKYRKVVNKGSKCENLIKEITDNKDNFYFLDFNTTIQILYYDWNPFYTLPEGFYNNNLYLAGIMSNFPDYNKVLKNNDIESPLKDLAKDNVYIIDSDSKNLSEKVDFLKEHYYPEAYAELYKEVDGYQIWKISKE